MNKPVLISGVAVLAVGVMAATLWLKLPHDTGQIANDRIGVKAHASPALAPDPGESSQKSVEPGASQLSPPGTLAQGDKAIDAPAVQGTPEALAQYRQSLEQRYAGLGKALNLTPEEVNRILEIMVRFQKESMTESSDLATVRQQAQATELMAALGSKYLQFEEYNLAPTTRDSVDALQTLFEISDVKPMTAAQAGSLATTLTAEQVRINRDLGSVTLPSKVRDSAARIREEIEWDSRYTPEINRRLVLAASRHLDAQQLAGYRKMLEDGHNRVMKSMRADLARREALESGR